MNTKENPVRMGDEIFAILPFYVSLDMGGYVYQTRDLDKRFAFSAPKKVRVWDVDDRGYVEIHDLSTGALFFRNEWDYFHDEESAKEFCRRENVTELDAMKEESIKNGILF